MRRGVCRSMHYIYADVYIYMYIYKDVKYFVTIIIRLWQDWCLNVLWYHNWNMFGHRSNFRYARWCRCSSTWDSLLHVVTAFCGWTLDLSLVIAGCLGLSSHGSVYIYIDNIYIYIWHMYIYTDTHTSVYVTLDLSLVIAGRLSLVYVHMHIE